MHSPVNIALVDDHSLFRNGVKRMISSLNTVENKEFVVRFEASNGKEFIEKLVFSDDQIDIVLLDINMPVMNGEETMEWIKRHRPSLKVIILTMMDDLSLISSMLKKGAKGYLTKDSTQIEFDQGLRAVASGGFYFSERIMETLEKIITSQQKVKKSDIVLSEREMEFLKLSCTEMTYREIAEQMQVSPRTVDNYRDELLKKLNVHSRIGLVTFAIRNGICEL